MMMIHTHDDGLLPDDDDAARFLRMLPSDYHEHWLANKLFELWAFMRLVHVGPTPSAARAHVLCLYTLSGRYRWSPDVYCTYDTSVKTFNVCGTQYAEWSDAIAHLYAIS